MKYKKIAIVYDWIDKWGGVERVLLTLHEMFPKATFFTSVYNPLRAAWAKRLKIKTSFMQGLPGFIKKQRIISTPLYPFAFESFNFNEFDLVISVTSSFAKSIITQPGTLHVCYLLTPARFLWSHEKDYIRSPLARFLLGGYLDYLKSWDKTSAQRPDKIISISGAVKNRAKKYYGRDSGMIYPPFDTKYWTKIKNASLDPSVASLLQDDLKGGYFLIVSRLEPYKKIDLAIRVFNKRKKKLVIVGEGSEEKALKKISGKNIIFLSRLTDTELSVLYKNAEALIMPQEEDFGYVALEAAFFGSPVISYRKGGAREIIIEGRTGIFFDKQSERSLQGAIERFAKIKYNLRTKTKKYGHDNVKRFDKEAFKKKLKAIL